MLGAGVQPRYGEGGGGKAPRPNKINSARSRKKKKSLISQKLRIAQEKSFMHKWVPDQFQSILQIWLLLKKVEFFKIQRPYAILSDMKFYANHFFQHIAHLFCRDGHFWGWGGVCMSLVLTGPEGKIPTLLWSLQLNSSISARIPGVGVWCSRLSLNQAGNIQIRFVLYI